MNEKTNETEDISLEVLAKKLFPALYKAGLGWDKMDEARIIVEELRFSESYPQAAVAPKSFKVNAYIFKPKMMTSFYVSAYDDSVIVKKRKGNIISDPPITSVRMYYRAKDKRGSE